MDGERIKVKRDGPRGWHWIAAHNFDPAIHEAHVEPEGKPSAADPPAAAQPVRTRQKRNQKP